MQAPHWTRPLLVSVAVMVAGSAMAQASDKDPSSTTSSKQSVTKSSPAKRAAATKRLDFVPSGSVKETTLRTQPAQSQPAKEGWHCDHSQASDA